MDTPGTTIRTPLFHQLGRLFVVVSALALAFAMTGAPYALSEEDNNDKVWICKYVQGPDGELRPANNNNPQHVSENALKFDEDGNPVFADAHATVVLDWDGEDDPSIEDCTALLDTDTDNDTDTGDDTDNGDNTGGDNDTDNGDDNDNGDSTTETGTTSDVEQGVLDTGLDQEDDHTTTGSVDQEVLSEGMTELPRTGADDPGLLAGLAVLLFAAGAGLLRLGRRFEPTI